MRKLSMKKPGIPASEDEKASGSGGVSAEGDGARGPCGRADDPALPFAAPTLFACGPPAALRLRVPGVLRCGRCARTLGAGALCGGFAAGGAGVVLGAGVAVEVLGTGVSLTEIEELVSCAPVCVVAALLLAPSAARPIAGEPSASAPSAASSAHMRRL